MFHGWFEWDCVAHVKYLQCWLEWDKLGLKKQKTAINLEFKKKKKNGKGKQKKIVGTDLIHMRSQQLDCYHGNYENFSKTKEHFLLWKQSKEHFLIFGCNTLWLLLSLLCPPFSTSDLFKDQGSCPALTYYKCTVPIRLWWTRQLPLSVLQDTASKQLTHSL